MIIHCLFLILFFLNASLFGTDKPFMVGGWVSYWYAENSIQATKSHIDLFDQISPFSYEVKPSGALYATFHRKKKLWNDFREFCRNSHKQYVPTIYWTDTEQMHYVLSDNKKRDFHIKHIVDTVVKNNYDGININYERVCSHDRNNYLTFVQQLSKELHKRQLVLYTSIGGRTSDNTIAIMQPDYDKHKKHGHTDLKKHAQKYTGKTHISLNPGKGADAIHYKKVLAECFDQVIFMGYDEWGRPYKYSNEALKGKYYISHASNQWIEQILQYALSFLPPHKIILGIPTYGLEFAIASKKSDIVIKKKRNLYYPDAQEIAHMHKVKPQRTLGGELSYCYKLPDEERYICYLDAQAIKDKIALAKRYRIKGVYFFTVHGKEDEAMWPMLKKELLYSSLR